MSHRTSASAAFAIAASLMILTAAPSRAVETSTTASEAAESVGKPLSLTREKKPRAHVASRARKARAVASAEKKKAAESRRAEARQAEAKRAEASRNAAKRAEAAGSEKKIDALPESVANANAQMPSTEARGEAAMTGAVPLESAANDQLTELSRSLAAPPAEDAPRMVATEAVVNDQPPAAVPALAPPPQQPRPAPAQASVAAPSDAWGQSSLIGKIFIAFGGLLTLASAARMLIA